MLAAKTLTLLALLFTLPVFGTETPQRSPSGDIAQRLHRIEQLDEQLRHTPDLAHADAMRRAYRVEFSQIDDVAHLRAESDPELRSHWDAVTFAAFYSDDTTTLDAVQRVHAEMEHRGLADAKTQAKLFNFLLKAGRFDAARKFATRHPDIGLPTIPEFIEAQADSPSVWRFNTDDSKAERIGIDLQPLQIIIAAGCHFSADAARDIARDPVLGPVFTTHAHWLSLQPGNEELGDLARWNREHPQAPMLPIHDRSEWALIPRWAMPTFFVIRNGKILDSTSGWASDDPASRKQLVALLERTGLLAAGTH